jgi:hypothetical protein
VYLFDLLEFWGEDHFALLYFLQPLGRPLLRFGSLDLIFFAPILALLAVFSS